MTLMFNQMEEKAIENADLRETLQNTQAALDAAEARLVDARSSIAGLAASKASLAARVDELSHTLETYRDEMERQAHARGMEAEQTRAALDDWVVFSDSLVHQIRGFRFSDRSTSEWPVADLLQFCQAFYAYSIVACRALKMDESAVHESFSFVKEKQQSSGGASSSSHESFVRIVRAAESAVHAAVSAQRMRLAAATTDGAALSPAARMRVAAALATLRGVVSELAHAAADNGAWAPMASATATAGLARAWDVFALRLGRAWPAAADGAAVFSRPRRQQQQHNGRTSDDAKGGAGVVDNNADGPAVMASVERAVWQLIVEREEQRIRTESARSATTQTMQAARSVVSQGTDAFVVGPETATREVQTQVASSSVGTQAGDVVAVVSVAAATDAVILMDECTQAEVSIVEASVETDGLALEHTSTQTDAENQQELASMGERLNSLVVQQHGGDEDALPAASVVNNNSVDTNSNNNNNSSSHSISNSSSKKKKKKKKQQLGGTGAQDDSEMFAKDAEPGLFNKEESATKLSNHGMNAQTQTTDVDTSDTQTQTVAEEAAAAAAAASSTSSTTPTTTFTITATASATSVDVRLPTTLEVLDGNSGASGAVGAEKHQVVMISENGHHVHREEGFLESVWNTDRIRGLVDENARMGARTQRLERMLAEVEEQLQRHRSDFENAEK
ncbi:hypothetical protein HDU83_005010 [Entophlyctis luteolus]|nr:hypothetical protein HDU83_005010 [Entophlyctis luteolus]